MTPIGTADAPFSGKLDGNNHTISGLSITQSYYVSHIGLFGSLAGQVTDLTLEDCHISVSSSSTSVSVGGIVGTANAPVRSCDVELEVTLSPNTTSKSCPIASGGIVGSAEGSIDQCWNRGEVVARAESSRTSSELASYMVAYAGGIAGRAAGSISDCFNTAYIAGFAHAISTNTYGAVSSTTYVGGVAGHCAALQRCYSIASVYSGNIANRPFIGDYNGRITIYCGAVAGMVTDTAADCHYLESMPHAFGSADADCEADSITSLTRQDTYRQFDFDAVWQFVDGDYAFPVLRAVPFTLPAHNGAAFSGGVGTLTDPYLITTVEQLRLISQDLSAAYRLDADLRVGSWTPLGLSDAAPFTGYLDGNGHTLSGVILQETEEDYCGFFGCSVGLIENLTLSGLQCSFTGGSHLGGLAGYAGGLLRSCTVSGTVTATFDDPYWYYMTDFYTDRFVGGLVGSGCHVYDCHSAVALTLSEATIGATDHRTYVGGLAGEAEELYRCQNSGAVTVSATATNYSIGKPRNFVYVGGVAGTADVRESSNRGALQLSCHVINDTSSNGGGFIYGYLGGILGRGTSVQNCYATGSMHIQAVADKSFSSYPNSCADVCVNPIVGIDPRTGFVPNLETVTCCYQMGSVTSATGGNATPKVTIGTTPAVYGADHLAVSSLPASMSIPATYQDFDFDEIWSFDADSAYPKLRWEMESPNAITFESTPAEVYETVEGCSPDLSALMLRLHYADRTVVGRASAAYLLDYDPNTLGEQRVKLRLGDAESEESILIRVVKKTATAIEMQTLPTKTIYERNYDAFDPAGGSIRISYDNGTSEILPLTADMVSGFDNLTAGTCTITVNHSDLSCSFPVEIIYLYALGLDTLPTKLSYVQGQPLDLSGAVLIGVYSNRTSKEIPLSEVQVSYNTGAVGTVSVTLSYRSCSTSFNITVNKKVIASYTFTKPDTQYVLGESLRGGQFLVTYVSEDNYQETIPLTDALLTGFDTTEEGIRKATATYFGCEETFWYNVLPLIASVSYTETTDGLEVTLTLNLDASDAHLILASYENDQMYTSTLGVWNAEESSFEFALKHADAGQTFCLYILQSDYTPRTDKTPVVLSASAA